MYSNNIQLFQESTTILNAHTKKSLETYRMHLVCMYVCMYLSICLFIITQKKADIW